jgi:ketosteroid isomerase-like protein
MKRYLCPVLLALGLCLTLASQDRAAWSAEQQDAWNSFSNYLKAVQQGNIKAMLAFWHPKYISWNYAQEMPTDFETSQKGLEEFFKAYRMQKNDCRPLKVQVEGDVAILYVRFSSVISDSSGKDIASSGPETVILAKKNKMWMMVGLVWIEK